MQSLPVITYPFGWEPPKYHLGMTLMFDGEIQICSGIEYRTPGSLESGWWYYWQDDYGSYGFHEDYVFPVVRPVLRQKQLVY